MTKAAQEASHARRRTVVAVLVLVKRQRDHYGVQKSSFCVLIVAQGTQTKLAG